MWKLISNKSRGILYRGDRLKVELVPANKAEDRYIDFMLFNNLADDNGLSLIRTSGYNAGHIGVTFPPESIPEGHSGTSLVWLGSNWKKWMPVNGKVIRIWKNSHPPPAVKPKSLKIKI